MLLWFLIVDLPSIGTICQTLLRIPKNDRNIVLCIGSALRAVVRADVYVCALRAYTLRAFIRAVVYVCALCATTIRVCTLRAVVCAGVPLTFDKYGEDQTNTGRQELCREGMQLLWSSSFSSLRKGCV